jgi:hypothetical protein
VSYEIIERRMFEDEYLEEFKCALSENKHFIIEPITLIKCGHSACKGCFPEEKTNLIKCKTCGVVSEFDFPNAQVSKALKLMMKFCYESMYKILEKETILKLNFLKSIHSNFYFN